MYTFFEIVQGLVFPIITLVIPMAPMFSLKDVVAFPVPIAPAKKHAIPSTATPRLMACGGGGGAPDSLAHA